MSTGPPAKQNGNGRIPRWALPLGTIAVVLILLAVLPRIIQQYQPTTPPIDMQPLVDAVKALEETTADEAHQTRSALTNGFQDQKSVIADLLMPPDLDYVVPAPPEEPNLSIALEMLASDVAAVDERVATLQRVTDELAGRPQPGLHPTPEEDFVPIEDGPAVELRRSIAELEDRIAENSKHINDARRLCNEMRAWTIEQLKLKQDKSACPRQW